MQWYPETPPSAPAAYTCGRCRRPAPASHRYCVQCGAPLVVPVERRTVSVLAVDIVGYTALAARLDLARVRELQRAYFGVVDRVVRRWNGVVEKYVGDGAVAVFGAARADEYEISRAVHAGLDLPGAVAARFGDDRAVRVRVGIATGETLIDLAAGPDLPALASGNLVQQAGRIQACAAPGTVAVDAATVRATAHLIGYERAPAEGRAIWRPAAAPARSPRPVETAVPLIGRDAELTELARRVRAAVTGDGPRLVCVVAEAGMGRSRLLRAAAGESDALWWVGRCAPGPAGRYTALADILRQQTGLADTADRDLAYGRVAAWVSWLLGPAAAASLAGGLTATLRSSGRSPEVEWAWSCLIRAVAVRRPLVLAIEDLHWADPSAPHLLQRLATGTDPARHRLAVVATSRTALPDPVVHLRPIHLGPLSPADTTRLLRRILDRVGAPPSAAARLLPLAGGNPLYAWEYARALAAGGRSAPEPPALVHDLVSARLDALDPGERAALAAAAVLGDRATVASVATLTRATRDHAERILARLTAAHLLTPRPGGGVWTRYAFPCAAVRHLAYSRLLRSVRVAHHLRAARWWERRAGGRKSTVDTEGSRHRRAAGELRAMEYRPAPGGTAGPGAARTRYREIAAAPRQPAPAGRLAQARSP